MPTNPHERAARSEKVLKLLAATPMASSAFENDVIADFLAGLSQQERDIFANAAGTHSPSRETWQQLVRAVRGRKTLTQAMEAI